MLKFTENQSLYKNAYKDDLAQSAIEILKEEKDSDTIGYYKLPTTTLDIIEKLKEYEKENDIFKTIENIVVMGIGGSSLGAKAVDSMLKHKNTNGKKLFFFENSDPVNITTTLNQLKKDNTFFIVISKSGGTIETISTFKTVLAHFDINLESKDSKRLMAITDNGSILSKFAEEFGIKEFNLPLNVGGRFSVLSSVGIIPLYLAGYDVGALLSGARIYEESFFAGEQKEILEKACFMYQNKDQYTSNVVFAYSNSLEDLAKWYVQLWGESLGKIDKDGNKVGLTPIGLTGSVDQHSFLQLIIEGPENKTVTFINVEDFENDLAIPNISLKHIEKCDFINGRTFNELINAQCDATMQSIEDTNLPTDKITISKLDEVNCGALIMYYEILTSLVGAMLNVNTYNQPGVELGKVILDKKFKG
jgi:glucose-6-phosphate isomerase